MNNITQPSTYKFEINFEYPDPYTVGTLHPFTMNQEVVASNIATAWFEMDSRWSSKYDLTKVKSAKITVEITPVVDLPPAA